MVSNFAYSRWNDAYPFVRKRIDEIHAKFANQVKEVDNTALAMYHDNSPLAAVEMVTEFSVLAGDKLHEEWLDFYGELFARFRDFSTIVPNAEDTRCGCTATEPGMSEGDKRRIVMETGTHYQVPESAVIGLSSDSKATY
jgi:hypothetical protein